NQEVIMFHFLLGHDRKLRSLRVRAPSGRQRSCPPQLEMLEQRLAPATYTWDSLFGTTGVWSDPRQWGPGNLFAPRGDPDAVLQFVHFLEGERVANRDDYPGEIPIHSIEYHGPDIPTESDPNSSIELLGNILVAESDGIATLHLNMRLSSPSHLLDVHDHA